MQPAGFEVKLSCIGLSPAPCEGEGNTRQSETEGGGGEAAEGGEQGEMLTKQGQGIPKQHTGRSCMLTRRHAGHAACSWHVVYRQWHAGSRRRQDWTAEGVHGACLAP